VISRNRPLVIVNPAAGGGRARGFWQRCAAHCASAGVDLEVIETRRRGDAADYAAAAGDRLVVSVGGDGTAHEVVNGLLRRPHGQPPRFAALLRGGTAGDLARSVPSPSRPEQVPAWLATDRWRRLDAGRLATSTGRRYFINVADAGIGAEVVRRAARGPAWVGGTGNFLGGAVVSLLTHRNAPVRLRLDEGPVLRRRIRTIAVANGAFLGGGMWIAPKARIDDGPFKQVEFAQGRRVEIDSDEPVGVEADGELAGSTPAVFEIMPGALEVIDWQPSGILSGNARVTE